MRTESTYEVTVVEHFTNEDSVNICRSLVISYLFIIIIIIIIIIIYNFIVGMKDLNFGCLYRKHHKVLTIFYFFIL